MEENLFLAFYNENSQRHAVLDDNGTTAWFYLHHPSKDPNSTSGVETDIFVYNRVELIEIKEVKNYKPNPPPIAKEYGYASAVCKNPKMHKWSVVWSTDGESVLLLRDEEPWCLIAKDNNNGYRGYSKSIKSDGPWGHPWDNNMLKVIN